MAQIAISSFLFSVHIVTIMEDGASKKPSVLIVGGLGMLSPVCQSIVPDVVDTRLYWPVPRPVHTFKSTRFNSAAR